MTGVCSDPDVALLPAQAPEAVQPVALLAFHVNVERPPAVTEVGLAEKFRVGAASRLTVAERDVEPPLPVQASVKVAAALIGPTLWLPFTDLLPDQPPLAVQLVALLVVQLSVLEPRSPLSWGSRKNSR